MTTSLLNVPQPTKESHPRQRSINISDLFLTRWSPPWSRPPSLPAYTWRNWVLNQPIATAYRETLIANILSLDWKITPREASYKRELEPTIKYYSQFLMNGGEYLGTDYSGLVEWIAGDVLDLPFGGAAELGRRDDSPGGRVMWLRPLDAGTLYPTLNANYPVVQYYQGYDAVAFPAHAIVRTYLSPQSTIFREGWGMAPPEKAYFSINLLNNGDKYYANLLLDVPTAGILDLGDMEKSSAEEWVGAFKTFMNDQAASFRVPVLYEHNNDVKFISFGKVPNDIMYDSITMRYAALLGSCYGMEPHDIGIEVSQGSGGSLAGAIRSERQTRRNGIAKMKAKMKYFFDKILPPTLEFNFIDMDEEQIVAVGRARLASATAFNLFQTNGNFSQQEIRSQAIQDGLFDIAIPDKLPRNAKAKQDIKFWHQTLGNQANANGDSQKDKPTEPETVGSPKAVSGGGEGDIKKLASRVMAKKSLDALVENIVSTLAPKFITASAGISEDEIYVARSVVSDSLFVDDKLGLKEILKSLTKGKSLITVKSQDLDNDLDPVVSEKLLKSLKSNFNEYLANTITVMLSDQLLTEDNVVSSFGDVELESLNDRVSEYLHNSFEEIVSTYLANELEQILANGS